MAMVVKNNMSAVNTLNTLNKNQSALGKSLQKVSSGMKINSAQDDASGYAISERMRVMIRSLDQANQNTQNGSSLMKVAEGSVSNTVEILKTLKEKAINAATDTNTDEDRAIIQKEIDQLVDQIDDNALITFNGKYLLDGSKVQSGQATYTTFTNQMLAVGTTGADALTSLKNRNSEDLGIISTDKITASYVRNGETFVTTFQVSDCTLSDIFKKLEGLEDETQFAGATNKSVLAAIGGDLTDETIDKTSTDTVSKYSMEALEAAKDKYTTALSEAQAAADEAHDTVGHLLSGSVVYNTDTKLYEVDSQKAAGLAGEIAKILAAAANLGDLTSQNTGTVAITEAMDAVNTQDDAIKKMAVWLGTISDTEANAKAADAGKLGGAVDGDGNPTGTDTIGTDPTSTLNLTGYAAIGTDAAVASDVLQWDGLSFNVNAADTNDTIKTILKAVQTRLEAVDESEAGTEKKDAARVLANQLNDLIRDYSNALDAAEAADDALEVAKTNLSVVTDAIEVEDLKEAMLEAKDGMATVIKAELDQLAHPKDADGNPITIDSTADGTDSKAKNLIDNQKYIFVKLLTTSAYSADNNPNITDTAAFGAYTSLGQYSSDDSSTLEDIAQKLSDKIYENITSFVTGKGHGDGTITAATDKITAQDAMRAILKSIAQGDAADGTGATALGAKALFNTLGYGKNTDKNDTTGETGPGAKYNAWSGGESGNWGSDISGDLSDAVVSDDPDINGFAAAYDKYAVKMYSVTATNKPKLDNLMSDVSITSSDDPYLISSKNIGLNTANAMVTTADGTEGITVTSNIAGLRGQISGITISVADAQGNVRKSVNTSLNAWGVTIFASNEAEKDNSLKFHIGAQANQSIAVDIKDMRAAALGLKGDDGKVVSVATQEKANAAIAVFENALQKALDQQTTIGAIEARLEYTSSNLTTSTENVQAAESTIRDADMAKEMTNYTKNNVLLQAAQSMLAQANQNSSAVLSLLQ